MERRTFKPGKTFLEYTIIKHIGKGAFTDIYYVKDTRNSRYALKVEPKDARNSKFITNEAKTLKMLQMSRLFPKYKTSGITQNYLYVVDELLGPSLSTVRKLLPNQKFTLSTGLRIGVEMLRVIEALHNKGLIHRDIKPSNFLIRASRSTPITLIDYSLTRSFVDPETKAVLPPRDKVGFAGTAKYASLNAHALIDLSPRDDLISWFFSLLEMLNGELPWTSVKDRAHMQHAKQEFDATEYCADLPPQIASIYKCLIQYKFEERPNYRLLMSFLLECINESGVSWSDPYDWDDSTEISRYTVIDLTPDENDRPNVPRGLPPPTVPGEEETELHIPDNESFEIHEDTNIDVHVPQPEQGPNCCSVQ